jgi:hypothetical protein
MTTSAAPSPKPLFHTGFSVRHSPGILLRPAWLCGVCDHDCDHGGGALSVLLSRGCTARKSFRIVAHLNRSAPSRTGRCRMRLLDGDNRNYLRSTLARPTEGRPLRPRFPPLDPVAAQAAQKRARRPKGSGTRQRRRASAPRSARSSRRAFRPGTSFNSRPPASDRQTWLLGALHPVHDKIEMDPAWQLGRTQSPAPTNHGLGPTSA